MTRAILVAICLLTAWLCAAQELTVAAASDLQFALSEIAANFEKQTGAHVKLVFGSSGNLFTQIENGAPFDLFFSADIDYPQKLESAGLAQAGTLYEYAQGKLVLWARKSDPVDLSQGLKVLLEPSVKKIAIANPDHAPYGRAAVAALKRTGIYDRVADKLVLAENISQTLSFVVSGSADVGMVALSLALAPTLKDKGKYVEVPTDEYPSIRQAAVILSASKQKVAAEQFLAHCKNPNMLKLLSSYGFTLGGNSH